VPIALPLIGTIVHYSGNLKPSFDETAKARPQPYFGIDRGSDRGARR
jgi:hypothetical protein